MGAASQEVKEMKEIDVVEKATMVMANKMTEFMNQTMVVLEWVEKKVDMLELSIGEIKMKQEQGAKERMTIYKQLEDMEVPPRRKRYDCKAKKACSYCVSTLVLPISLRT